MPTLVFAIWNIVLGLESRVKHHLLDVLEERATLDEALVPGKHSELLFLLAAAQSREKDDVDTAKMKALISSLRERFDYVLHRLSRRNRVGFSANAVAGAVTKPSVICTPEVAAVRDVDRVVGLLGNRFRPQLVINRLRPNLVKKGKMLSVEDVNAILRPSAARRDRRRARNHRNDEPLGNRLPCVKRPPTGAPTMRLPHALRARTCPRRCRRRPK